MTPRSTAPDPAALVAAGADVGNVHPFPPAIDAPWMEEAHGHVDTRPEVPPPADDRAELVRHDLARTAYVHGMRCVGHLATTADGAATWDMIARDLGACDFRALGSRGFATARAAAGAARAMGAGDFDGAIATLADHCGLSSAEWLASQRAARDEREGGDALVPSRDHLRSRARHDAGERDDGVSRR